MQIFKFPNSGAAEEADDHGQVPDNVVIVLEEECLVAVNASQPFAVTSKPWGTHFFTVDWLIREPEELKALVVAIEAAVAEAIRLDFVVDPRFMVFAKPANCPFEF